MTYPRPHYLNPLIRPRERMNQVVQLWRTSIDTFGDQAPSTICTVPCYAYTGDEHRRFDRTAPAVHREQSWNCLLPLEYNQATWVTTVTSADGFGSPVAISTLSTDVLTTLVFTMGDQLRTIVDSFGETILEYGVIDAILAYPHKLAGITYRQVTLQVA